MTVPLLNLLFSIQILMYHNIITPEQTRLVNHSLKMFTLLTFNNKDFLARKYNVLNVINFWKFWEVIFLF